jgi:hypothetical protein
MAISRTDIANQALTRIGERVIMDLDDASSITARKCKVIFEQSVRELGASHSWNGLKARIALAEITTPPPFGWEKQFQLPVNYLRLVKLNGNDCRRVSDLYEIEGTKLLTDEDTADIEYIAYTEDTANFHALFTKALVTLLASNLAVSLRQDEAMGSNLKQVFETVDLPRARMKDGNEQLRRRYNPVSESTFVASRRRSTNG